MHLTTSLSLFLASLSWAIPTSKCGNFASPIEGLTQGGYRLAHAIDSKNFTLLDQAITDDVHYDSSALAPYGGVSNGRQAVTAAIKGAYYSENVRMEHLVTNLFLLEMQGPDKARVVTDITWSHWDSAALNDIQKTFRFYYQCDDIWVCQNGGWAMKYSVVKNMGPGVEVPYQPQVLGPK